MLRNERPPIFEIRMYDAQQQLGNYRIFFPLFFLNPVWFGYGTFIRCISYMCSSQEVTHVERIMAAVVVCVWPLPLAGHVPVLRTNYWIPQTTSAVKVTQAHTTCIFTNYIYVLIQANCHNRSFNNLFFAIRQNDQLQLIIFKTHDNLLEYKCEICAYMKNTTAITFKAFNSYYRNVMILKFNFVGQNSPNV